MILGLWAIFAAAAPPRAFSSFQSWFRGDYYTLWFCLFLVATLVGLVMNMFGGVSVGPAPAAPATQPSKTLNFVGDGLMLSGSLLLFLLFFPSDSAQGFQTWLKTPSSPSSGIPATGSFTSGATFSDPVNPRYTGETVIIDNDPPAGMELAVIWKGGSTPPEGPPFNSKSGGWRFGPFRQVNIGSGATDVKVRFESPDGKKLSALVPVK
jgi:hypothetical protein